MTEVGDMGLLRCCYRRLTMTRLASLECMVWTMSGIAVVSMLVSLGSLHALYASEQASFFHTHPEGRQMLSVRRHSRDAMLFQVPEHRHLLKDSEISEVHAFKPKSNLTQSQGSFFKERHPEKSAVKDFVNLSDYGYSDYIEDSYSDDNKKPDKDNEVNKFDEIDGFNYVVHKEKLDLERKKLEDRIAQSRQNFLRRREKIGNKISSVKDNLYSNQVNGIKSDWSPLPEAGGFQKSDTGNQVHPQFQWDQGLLETPGAKKHQVNVKGKAGVRQAGSQHNIAQEKPIMPNLLPLRNHHNVEPRESQNNGFLAQYSQSKDKGAVKLSAEPQAQGGSFKEFYIALPDLNPANFADGGGALNSPRESQHQDANMKGGIENHPNQEYYKKDSAMPDNINRNLIYHANGETHGDFPKQILHYEAQKMQAMNKGVMKTANELEVLGFNKNLRSNNKRSVINGVSEKSSHLKPLNDKQFDNKHDKINHDIIRHDTASSVARHKERKVKSELSKRQRLSFLNNKTQPIKSERESLLRESEWRKNREPAQENIVSPHIYMNPAGDLGNQMFEIASLFGIATKTGRQPFMSTLSEVYLVFANANQSVTARDPKENVGILFERKQGGFNENLFNLPQTDLVLCCYLQSWRYFSGLERDIRHMFKFRIHIQDRAQRILMQSTKQYYSSMSIPSGKRLRLTYIGVHAKHKYLTSDGDIKKGYRLPSAKYYHKAMDYYRRHFSNTLFIVTSDDIHWCKAQLSSSDVYLVEGQHSAINLAVLSMTNHTVISTGAFSWWAGWLAGGQVIYYRNWLKPGSDAEQLYNSRDYFLPNWNPVGDLTI